MEDLRKWIDSRKVSSTLEAAQLRGLGFTTLADAFNDEPFFVQNNQIIGHALEVKPDEFIDLILVAEVEWQTIAESIKSPWINIEQQQKFSDRYLELLKNELEQVEAWSQRVNIDMVLPSGKSKIRKEY